MFANCCVFLFQGTKIFQKTTIYKTNLTQNGQKKLQKAYF
ncbi:hypothetical protein ADIS_0552 [Lunatimonas lonarensis]|uniref:Uncharacterized protein n=1 Tax=Lunatimonas lonarensis TaxID=1232681 RepID=R7ZY64_9BACT|nr:hypothetical protein ADIS_0552 [Lunatimonas lonarensis]